MYIKFFQDLVTSFELQKNGYCDNWYSDWILKEKMKHDSKT